MLVFVILMVCVCILIVYGLKSTAYLYFHGALEKRYVHQKALIQHQRIVEDDF